MMPCLHQFCYPCIAHWAEIKPECPLCKRRVRSILHSVRVDNDFEEHVIPPPAAPAVVVSHRTGGGPAQPAAHSLHRPAARRPPAAGMLPMAPVGSFCTYVWASIFRTYPAVLHPLLLWLREELGRLFEGAQEAAAAQSLVITSLRCFGPDEEAVVQLLQASLGRHTRSFVHQLVDTIVRRCGGEARHRMGLEDAYAAEGQEGSPAAAAGPLPPQGGLLPPAQPFIGVPAAPATPPFPPMESKKSRGRTRRWLCPGPPLPAGAANAPARGPNKPRRRGPAELRSPPSPARGHPAVTDTGGLPQGTAEPWPGRHLGLRPDTRRSNKINKVRKTAEKVSGLLPMWEALVSPPVRLSPPFPSPAPTSSSRVCWTLLPAPPRRPAMSAQSLRSGSSNDSAVFLACGTQGTGSHAVGPGTPRGRGTGAGDGTRLRSTEEQRHQPLCFSSPGERWQCLAPAVSSGLLWFQGSSCSLETLSARCDLGLLQGLQGALRGAPPRAPFAAQREQALRVGDRARACQSTSDCRNCSAIRPLGLLISTESFQSCG